MRLAANQCNLVVSSMIALIQRVSHAKVEVKQQTVGQIGAGILLFLGVEKHDEACNADKLLDKVLHYRIFNDAQGRMQKSLLQQQGELLVVSQFTLVADTQTGTRAGFSKGAPAAQAATLYHYFVEQAQTQIATQTGEFGANMQVSLNNDGPVTFWLTS